MTSRRSDTSARTYSRPVGHLRLPGLPSRHVTRCHNRTAAW